MRTVKIKNIQYFYILHSSTQIIERVPMCKEFDITAKVTEGKKYGGYGKSYEKMGDYATVLFAGGGAKALKEAYPNAEFVNNQLQDNGSDYDGNQGTPVQYAVKKADFFYREYGKTMHPVADRLYALVELDSKYFKHSFVFFSQSVDSQGYVNAFGVFAALDGTYYQSVKAFINGAESSVKLGTRFPMLITVDGVPKTFTINPSNLGVSRGVVAAIGGSIPSASLQPETEYRMAFIVTTLDGVEMNTHRIVVLYTGQFTPSTMRATIEEI